MVFTTAINERTSGRYVMTLTDEDGALVGAARLEAATLSLFATRTGAIVNSRSNVDVLAGGSGWTFFNSIQSAVIDGETVTFNVEWQMTPADASILDDSLATEPHMAELAFVWGSGTKGKTHRFKLNVANLRTIGP